MRFCLIDHRRSTPLDLRFWPLRELDRSLREAPSVGTIGKLGLRVVGAHAKDELGISKKLRPRPIQAALSSAGSSALGALMPLLVTAIAPVQGLIPLVSVSSLALLALLGGLAARVGGAGVMIGAIRVTFWGGLAMAMTAGIGWLFGAVV